MSNSSIKVENVSKKYLISHEQKERYVALRDVLTRRAKGLGRMMIAPFGASRPRSSGRFKEEFWALKDINVEIDGGDRIGIIGHNGAGKSTLLKVLSRITEPTTGKLTIKGRVASLLEVGTGFHPELTGRENIYLNGAILGMSRTEIRQKFDEIVDFAEVEKFLDTAVKHYSSGMYVRLAFAVAAHLQQEILLVDEVLAVGDVTFQKKCIGKMDDVSRQGRTVLFVSHNMGAIGRLCSKTILLDKGILVAMGPTSEVIEKYINSTQQGNSTERTFAPNPDKQMQILGMQIVGQDDHRSSNLDRVYPFKMIIDHEVHEPTDGAVIEVILERVEPNYEIILRTYDADLSPERMNVRQVGRYRSVIEFPGHVLNAGTYAIRAWIFKKGGEDVHDAPKASIEFSLYDSGTVESYGIGHQGKQRFGILAFPLKWDTSALF